MGRMGMCVSVWIYFHHTSFAYDLSILVKKGGRFIFPSVYESERKTDKSFSVKRAVLVALFPVYMSSIFSLGCVADRHGSGLGLP